VRYLLAEAVAAVARARACRRPISRPSRRAARPGAFMLPGGVAPAVRARDSDMLIDALAPLVTLHANSLRGAHKFALYKVAEAEIKDASEAIDWAVELATRSEPMAKQFALHLLAQHKEGFDEQADAVLHVLQVGADDVNWEVRETAGGVLGRFVVERPEGFALVLRRWAASPSANQRRAVVLALKYAVRDVPDRAEEFLDLLEELATDSDEYVRKNLGPFAVGDGMLAVAPGPTLKRLKRWARSKDEWVRWNAASAFGAAAARAHTAAALATLRVLAGDRNPMVSRAVVRALLNLAQGDRAAVSRAVSAWGEDEPRRAAASAFKTRLVGRSM
jgi:hypothetical protein